MRAIVVTDNVDLQISCHILTNNEGKIKKITIKNIKKIKGTETDFYTLYFCVYMLFIRNEAIRLGLILMLYRPGKYLR